jgi:hypothetical protein
MATQVEEPHALDERTTIQTVEEQPARDRFQPPMSDTGAKFLFALFFVAACCFLAGRDYVGGGIELAVCVLMVIRIRSSRG